MQKGQFFRAIQAAKNGEQQLIPRPGKTADILCKPPKISFDLSMRFHIDILECQEDNPVALCTMQRDMEYRLTFGEKQLLSMELGVKILIYKNHTQEFLSSRFMQCHGIKIFCLHFFRQQADNNITP